MGGGKRLGAGRPKILDLRSGQYSTAISLIDDNSVKAVEVLIKGLSARSWPIKIKCAELLLKKRLPDLKAITSTPPKEPMQPVRVIFE